MEVLKLVIFTAHYPFEGESFVHAEIMLLAKYFNKIFIITTDQTCDYNTMSILPENVNFSVINKNTYLYASYFYAIFKFFSVETLREIYYSKNKLNIVINFIMLKKIFIYYFYYYKYNNIIKKCQFKSEKIIFYSYWLSQSAYALAKLKKQGYITKAISRAHGGDAFLDRGYNPFRREIYENLDQIHFVSEIALLQFKNKITLPSSSNKAKLIASPLGTIKNTQFLNLVSRNNKYFTIVSCSNIIPLKRLDLIVASLINIKNYSIKWVHFGDGFLKNEILDLVENQLSPLSNIEVDFKGQVSNDEILDFYEKHQVDLFINVSDYEGIPVSVMEAMSYGIPVIARNVGGNSEIVENGYNGILLSKHATSHEISQSILTLFNLPQDRINEYRKNAFNTWKHKFDAETNYKAFAKNIKEMLT